MNTFQWNYKRNSYIFIQENAFENVAWRIAAILSRPQYVKIRAVIYIAHNVARIKWRVCIMAAMFLSE